MMSKKQWFVLLCVYVTYLLLGASVFHEVESTKELREQIEDKKERIIIEELLVQHYVPNEEHTQNEIFDRLTSYCGRPLSANMSEVDPPIRWDYYHSLFFVITVVSTIGYGNLAPTTTITRIFMIFYAIVGMPMNGMLIINLGDYFGKSFLKLYHRWKTTRVQHALATLGLVGQVVLYLIPGFTFFIFIPSILIMVYEEWPYDVAVHYAFVTLTTIGFGDWVAGTTENGHGQVLYMAYKIFLLIWIISGLGYIFMVMGFVASGMRSKRLRALEHKLALNIKRTNTKIRDEVRTMVNEYLLMRVKRVYRENFIYVPNKRNRSQSCPNLKLYYTPESSPTIARKRAFSACVERITDRELTRIQSDSDLQRIDKERTFNPSNAMMEPGQFLLRMANALGNFQTLDSTSRTNLCDSQKEGVSMFPSKEILSSEAKQSGWSIGSQKIPQKLTRPRAASECRTPFRDAFGIDNNDLTWYGPSATKRLQELREQSKYGKTKTKTLPPFTPSTKPQGFFNRIKKTLKSNKDVDSQKNVDVEAQNYYSPSPRSHAESCNEDETNYNQLQDDLSPSAFSPKSQRVLEETSIADFLRALTAISVPELPQDIFDTTSLTPPSQTPKRMRRLPIQSFSRRTSLIPFSEPEPTKKQNRRFSLRPNVAGLEPPPPYYPADPNVPSTRIITKNRKFSIRPVSIPSNSSSLQRNVLKFKYPLAKDLSFKEPENKGGGSSNV